MASVNLCLDALNPRSWFEFGVRVTRNAVWADNPQTQIVTNIVIVAALLLSSSVGFAVGIPLALFALFFLGVGVLRLGVRFVAG